MDAPRPVSYDMSHYFGMLRRHWWIIALLTAAGLVGALSLAGTQQKVYDSTTYVLVMPTGSSASVEGGRTSGSVNLDTEAQLVTSAEVASNAAKLLKVTTAPSDLAAAVSVDVPANTSVMAITFAAATPPAAQAGSHAFATAYLANRQGSAQADITSQVNAINTKIHQQQATLAHINNDLAKLKPGSARYANAQSQRQTLNSQINLMTNRINNLSTTTVTSGKIITDAGLPTKPVKPSVPLFLTSGAMVGILLGIALAIARQRADKRVRFATDVPRRSGLQLLAQLPARVKPRFDDVFPPYGTGGRTFNRLRNEVLASLRETDQIIVVTGASKGPASTLVAVNLASALARAGSDVVLVCAHLPETIVDGASATRMLGVAATPGLSDVLAGKVPLDTATQRAPRNPWLRVITTGGTASATGFLQSQTLRDILAQLRTQAEYIVIEAPSTANSADAQSLASLADAAIVVVEIRRTTHTEVIDASDQLSRIATTMLGSVVLPRLKRSGDEVPTPPPPGRPVGAGVSAADGPFIEALPTAPMSAVRESTTRDVSTAAPRTAAQNLAARDAVLRGSARDRSAETIVSEGALGPRQAGTPAEAPAPGPRPVGTPADAAAPGPRQVGTPAEASTPGPRQVGTAAEAAAATSAAASGTADSFFGPDVADMPPAGPRRRILPGRRSPIRNAPPRRPSPARQHGVHPDGSDETVTFDAPVRVEAGAAHGEALPESDRVGGMTSSASAAPMNTAAMNTAAMNAAPHTPAPHNPAPHNPAPHNPAPLNMTPVHTAPMMPQQPATPTVLNGPGTAMQSPPAVATPKSNEGAPSTRTVPSVKLPDTTINKPLANPTNIVAPVLGATSIVVKPPTGAVGSAPTPAEPAPADGPTIKPREAGSAHMDEVGARISTGSTAGTSAIGSKTVPGAKATIGEPHVGSAGDTVTFQRIDLVYVEDGDGSKA